MDVPVREECKVVLLNLTARYAAAWSYWEGIREFIQNWHDGIYDACDKILRADGYLYREKQKVDFALIRDDDDKVVYEARVTVPDKGEVCYGSLHYDKSNKRLTLINRGISLQKKILLLGYSSHTTNPQVIGQFGEGLKIGALALVRQGRYVTMETNKERWQFALHPYEQYGGEQGLVVLVTESERIHCEHEEDIDFIFPPCPVDLNENDTSSSISSISPEEFEQCRERFLFLTPPKDHVKTEIGTLLLDEIFTGALFVKGSFVVDLRKDSLRTGVDFYELKIDRDRNAVPKISEIDHKVSCMWPRALETRNDLAYRYYNLLMRNADCRDVRHAKTYANADDSCAPRLIAQEFAKEYGDEAFPIADTFHSSQAASFQHELGRRIVQVNEVVLSILLQSGKYETLEEAREKLRPDKTNVRPLSHLTPEQNSVVKQAVDMVNKVDVHLKLNMIAVIDTKSEEKPAIRDERIEVPVWMVNQDVVHKYGKMCKGRPECWCRQIRICNALLALRRENIENPPGRHEKEAPPDQTLMAALCRFTGKKSGRQKPYCVDLHQSGHVLDHEKVHAGCVDEEERLRGVVKRIKLEQVDSQKEHQGELARLSHDCTMVRKDLMNSMVRDADMEAKIAALGQDFEDQLNEYKREKMLELNEKDEKIKTKDKELAEIEEQLDHKNMLVEEKAKHVEMFAKSMDHRHHALMEKVTFYQKTLREKADKVKNKDAKFSHSVCVQVGKTCKEICKELEGQSYMCIKCRNEKRSHILFPCHHYKFCDSCAQRYLGQKCPVHGCKQKVTEIKRVFE